MRFVGNEIFPKLLDNDTSWFQRELEHFGFIQTFAPQLKTSWKTKFGRFVLYDLTNERHAGLF